MVSDSWQLLALAGGIVTIVVVPMVGPMLVRMALPIPESNRMLITLFLERRGENLISLRKLWLGAGWYYEWRTNPYHVAARGSEGVIEHRLAVRSLAGGALLQFERRGAWYDADELPHVPTLITTERSPDGRFYVDFMRRPDGMYLFREFHQVSDNGEQYWTAGHRSGLHGDYLSARREAETLFPWMK